MSSIDKAKQKLDKLKRKNKFEKMVGATAVLTDLLKPYRIKPVIVGDLR
ncbi:hypothetical protein ACDX78_18370 [Virgibacillus oceani]